MYLAYPKRDVWLIIYEFVASAWAEVAIDGIPPPEPPCSDVWSMLSDNDKEEAWTLPARVAGTPRHHRITGCLVRR